jgi:hypothetical protein
MAVETIPFKIFCSIQTILRWWKFHAIQVEDVFVWLGLAMFLSFDCLYLKALPILELVVKASTGKLPPYATIMEDTSFLLGCLFAVQILFWGPLWCIKFSLLFWFKKLTVGLPNYMPVWYIIAGFTGLAHILSVVTQFTNCKSILAWLTPGKRRLPIQGDGASIWNRGMQYSPR